MKKVFAVLLAAMLTAMTCVPVLAAQSVSINGIITGGTTSSGTVTFSNNVTAPTAAEISAVLGSGYTLVDTTDVTVTGGTAPYTITMYVSGVTASTEGYFLHKTNGAWEKVAATFASGSVTGTFQSLSPIAVVIKGSSTSPKTGSSMMAVYMGILGAAALAGAVIISRKRTV